MSVSKNSITGDTIQTKDITEQYRNNYDLIFSKKPLVTKDIKLVDDTKTDLPLVIYD